MWAVFPNHHTIQVGKFIFIAKNVIKEPVIVILVMEVLTLFSMTFSLKHT